MIAYTDQFPGVTIVVPSSTLARFIVFELSIEALLVTSGSTLSRAMSANIALNCNEAVRLYPNSAYYWFIDDDHQFDQFTLLRLMAHDVPLVVPVTCLKDPPFLPVLYKEEKINGVFEHYDGDIRETIREILDPDGAVRTTEGAVERVKMLIERGPKRRPTKQFVPYSWHELDKLTGLLEVFACGRSGMLIRRDVFETMPDPWFELGKTNPEYAGEDMHFCEKLRAAGIPIKADLDLTFGHVGPVAAWPTRQADGRWLVRLTWANGQSIMVNRPGAAPIQVPARDQRGNKVAERMAQLVASGIDEKAAFEQAVKESEETP